MKEKLPFLFVLFVFSWPAITAQNLTRQELVTEVDRLLQSEIDRGKIPGAVILIKKGRETIYQQRYGYAREFDNTLHRLSSPEKTSPGHLYDLASLTKVIGTTTSIMLLVDSGQIRLEDPVAQYVPAFGTPEKEAITIRHLLTHSAGLIEWYPLYYRSSNRQDTYRLIGELPLKYPVGAQRHYSDLGFVLLGEIIERVSGLPLEQFMMQHIFKPLSMEHTTYNPLASGRFDKIAATSHGNPFEHRMVYDPSLGFQVEEIDPDSWNGWRDYTLVGEVNDGNAWHALRGVSGAAGLFSTAGDLQQIVDLLQHKGKIGDRQFISAGTIETFLTQDQFKNGLGWIMDPANPVIKNAPAGSFGHTGFTGTSIAVIPKYDLSVILLINRQNVGLQASRSYYSLSRLRQDVLAAVLKYGTTKID